MRRHPDPRQSRLRSVVMANTPLPDPESEQLAVLVGSGSLLLVYGLLHRRRGNPPTASEIRYFLQSAGTETSADLAVRGLRDYFEIAGVGHGQDVRYQLVGWAGRPLETRPLPISARLMAEVLAPARCAQCGRTPVRHGVVLNVDLRVPLDWGGTNDPENLQAVIRQQDGTGVSP